jgi:hypothetical protein
MRVGLQVKGLGREAIGILVETRIWVLCLKVERMGEFYLAYTFFQILSIMR